MKLYRAIVNNTHDHYDDPGFALYYQEHEVIRETPAFYIIKINGKEKRIGKKSKSQFAAPTKEKALMDAFYRNLRHRSILNSRMEYAKKVRDFIKEQINTL